MRRFYVPQEQISGGLITIAGSDINHLKNVLRMKVGDNIEVFDSKGRVYISEILVIKDININCKIVESRESIVENRISITLAQCLPKAKKMDFIVQKATELGANSIIPVISERSVPKIEDKADKKLAHWQKIAKEASEQSGRTKVPQVKELTRFDDLIKTAKDYSLSLIPWEGEKERTIKTIFEPDTLISRLPAEASAKAGYPDILLIIGPEGGYSQKEIEQAINAGLKTVSLGKRILRTETAGIVALAQIIYEFEL